MEVLSGREESVSEVPEFVLFEVLGAEAFSIVDLIAEDKRVILVDELSSLTKYLHISRRPAEALPVEGVPLGQEQSLLFAQLPQLIPPNIVLLLRRQGHLNHNLILLLVTLEDDPIGEPLVVDMRDLLLLRRQLLGFCQSHR